MLIRQLIVITLIALIYQIGTAQVELSGIVKDDNGPISFATVVLKDTTDKVLIYDITDEEGTYNLKYESGSYTFLVSILGYKNYEKEISLTKNLVLDDVQLVSVAQDLGVVTVKGRVPVIERKADRLVFNVSSSVAASGGNAVDALRVAPGLQIQNDAISMIGKGASRVMVNGRIMQLSGTELVDFLNSISSDDIQKIEIISNPPAKYEAGGSGGLINIILKKGVRESWKNSTTYSFNKNAYSFSSLRNTFSYNKNKIRFNLGLNGSLGDLKETENVTTRYPSGPWKNLIDTRSPQDNVSGRVSLDYDISDKNSIGVQYMGSLRAQHRDNVITTDVFDNSNVLLSKYDGIRLDERDIVSHVYNVHFLSDLDTSGRKISIDLDYFDFENVLKSDFYTDELSSNDEFIKLDQSALNFSDQFIDNYSAKVDVEHPLDLFNLSYGAKASFTKSVNKIESFNRITGENVFDPLLSNEFEYDENVQAVYVNGAKEINDKLSLQLGLRLENTITRGYSATLDQTNKNDYLKLFPTVYLSYAASQKHNFSVNYGRRIGRPWFRDLNPYRSFTNSFSYSEGNPFLQPSFNDNIDFYYTFNDVLTTNVYLSRTTSGSGVIFSSDPNTNIQAIVRENYFDDYIFQVGEIYTFNKLSWFESQNQAFLTGYKSVFNDKIDAEPRNGLEYYLSTNNTFIVGESTKLQVSFFYNSRHNYNLSTYSAAYGLDIGVKQSFFNDKLQAALFAKDIFNTSYLRSAVSEVNGVEVDFGSNYTNRFVRASLTYSFGNNKINSQNRRFGNEEERRRSN